MGKIKIKILIIFAALALLFGLAFIVLNMPQVTTALRDLMVSELRSATGCDVVVREVSVNPFPLFVEATEVKVRGKDGGDILHVPQMKGYIGLSRILKKEIIIRRLVLRGVEIRSSAEQSEDIIRNIKAYLATQRDIPVTVTVKSVVVDNGGFQYAMKDGILRGKGCTIEALLNTENTADRQRQAVQRITFSLNEISSSSKNLPDLLAAIKGTLSVRPGSIDLKHLEIRLAGSTIQASGEYSGEKGTLKLGADLLTESFREIFKLKHGGEGGIVASGSVRFEQGMRNPTDAVVALELKGEFPVKTLMEALKVEERIEGRASFTGSVTGPLRALTGNARVRLKQGNLFNIAVDDLTCTVLYKDGVLNFTEGKGSLYNGRATAAVKLAVTGKTDYSVDVHFSDVDSPPVLDLIGWKPDIPFGKVSGELKSTGAQFNPSGRFSYTGMTKGRDVLGRIKTIQGDFDLRGDLLTLSNIGLSTDETSARVHGTLDLASSVLSIALSVKSRDITDLTLPYRKDVTGAGVFTGTVSGPLKGLVVRGRADLSGAAYEGYPLGAVSTDITYKSDLLEIKELSAQYGSPAGHQALTLRGIVRFPESHELFEFKKSLYDLSLSIKNADIEKFAPLVYKKTLKTHPQGRFDALLKITGSDSTPLYKGRAEALPVQAGTVSLDSAALSFSYDQTHFIIEEAALKKGNSTVVLNGRISNNETFAFTIASGKLYLKDTDVRGFPAEASIALTGRGEGTVQDPRIELEGLFRGGKIRNADLGEGVLRVSVKNRTAVFQAVLADNRLTLNGKAELKDAIPWTARLDVRSGRYDFLIETFLKDIPEDLLINMRGHADMWGDKNHFYAKAVISLLNVTLYGYSFSNESEIKLAVADKKVNLSTIGMRSGNTSFKISGEFEIARGYDLVMEGTTALSPIKGFFKRIDTIRGDAGFVFSLTGKWDQPRIDGGVTITNGVFGLKDIGYRISSINGYLFMDEGRIVLQKLSGKVGGGDVELSGISYLQGFKVKRFYIDSLLSNIGVNVSKEFPVNFNGNILYRGTLQEQAISGEIRINRAKYREQIEWKSWLFKPKAKERPRGEPSALERAALNIKIIGSNTIDIDNNLARASLRIDMLLRGSVSNPVLFGRMETSTGSVYFRNNDFRIIHASADFSDPQKINPVMEIIAETSVQGYAIRLNLEGRLEQFNMALASTPPLNEMDILSLLATGRLESQLKGFESGFGAGTATSFLTGRVQDVFEERVRSITGLDRIEFDPYVSKSSGVLSTRVTVSKRLGDKLFVTYSTTVGSTEYNVLKMEYALSRHVSLIGIRDELGSIGGDVKFRFEFK